MSLITLYKKYADGEVRELSVRDTQENVMTLLGKGFFLTASEAKAGKVKPKAKPKAKAKPVPKKTSKKGA